MTIHKPRVTKHKPRLSDGERHPVVTRNVNVIVADLQRGERAALATIPEYGYDTYLNTVERGPWREVALSDCQYGCKVYRNERKPLIAVNHNDMYGCNITQAHIDAGVQHLPLRERDVLAEEPVIEEPLADWERRLLTGPHVTDQGHGEEYPVTKWERDFLAQPTPHQREWAALSL